ncbi:MAG: GNAT family N-acetyltransferase [Chitinivibrionales bacterium]|nr:GNAT family N-acetyltransferase [Chitinivibrionales bacterium]
MSTIRVMQLSEERRAEWEDFICRANNGTVFHRLSFLDYHPSERFAFHHLMFYKDDTLIAALPASITDGRLKSPAGASFGGFVVPPRLDLRTADQIIKELLTYCHNINVKEILITPPMQVYSKTFDESIEYAMLYNHFRQDCALYSSVIDLSQICDKTDLSRNTRHKINKAVNKNVRIAESDAFEEFYPILLKNKAKFGVQPTHTLEELRRIHALVPGMMKLFVAYHETKPIAGELLFAANDRCILNFYTMHLYEYRNLFAVNYLVEHALRWSVQQGYRYYDYGVSADTFSSDPMEPSWSLVWLKESMGAAGCMRKTYSRTIVNK